LYTNIIAYEKNKGGYMKKFFFFAFFLVLASSLFADAKLESIRAAIKAKGAKWTAGITSMSILSVEEQKMRLGWNKELETPPEERGIGPSVPPQKTYAESLDWRNYNGVNYITPIRDQGACGSCVCFGLLGAAEGMMNLQAGAENMETDMSEQELLSCGPGSCNGWNVGDAMNWMKYAGVSEEACFPYQANDNIPCTDRCERYPFTNRKAQLWGWCYSYVWGLKEEMQNGPIDVAFAVYEDFMSYTGGVYRHTWGAYEGGHSVTMVGWNDADSCWICKNSWGPNWGEDGYFRIAWGECGIEDYAAYLTMRPAGYPYLSLGDYLVDDSVGGDGDGVLNPGEQAKLSTEIINRLGWCDAQYVDATLRTVDSRVSITDSTASYGTIVDGDTVVNTSDQFEVQGVNGDSLGPVELTMYITAVGDSGSYWIELTFDIEYGWTQYGWPAFSEQVKTSPAIVDLNGDNKGEVIYGSEGGDLFVKNYAGSDFSPFPYHIANKIWGSPAVGDADNNGVTDIAFVGFNTNIYLVDENKNLKWSVTTGGPVTATPVLADLNNDNHLEVIVGSFDRKLYVLDSSGNPLNDSFPLTMPDGSMIVAGCAVGDINGDNTKEIIVASYGGYVYAISPDGVILPGWPFQTGGNIWDAPSMANLDGTGVKIAVGSTNDTVYVINSDGTIDFKVGTGGDVRSSPSFVDADGDNNLDVFFGSDDGKVYAYNHSGNPLANWPVAVSSAVKSQVVFSDLNNDNAPEVIVNASGGELSVFEGDGSAFDIFPVAVPGSPTTPAVEDCDGDGDLEIFFGNVNGMSAIDCKSQRGLGAYWNMFRCNLRRTGNYDDAEMGVEESTGAEISKFRIYPNPFNGTTKIVLGCRKGEKVNVVIYNIAGQKIREIESKNNATQRVIVWDGRNKNSEPVPTGVYFCVVKSATNGEVRRKLIKIE